jgi:hypothetical protein
MCGDFGLFYKNDRTGVGSFGHFTYAWIGAPRNFAGDCLLAGLERMLSVRKLS